MALGRRNKQQQGEFWVATQHLPTSPGHVFYEKLNSLFAEAKFDEWVEERCEPYYARLGRPSIPPGVYFRMLLRGSSTQPRSEPRDRAGHRRCDLAGWEVDTGRRRRSWRRP